MICKKPAFLKLFKCLQSLTKTIWWVVPVIWIPVVCWCQVIAIRRGFPVDKLLTTTPLGIFIWSLVEYTLHRFLFHVKTKSYW
jgi:dihydroceramide fatty acyl 2-hydroxylase